MGKKTLLILIPVIILAAVGAYIFKPAGDKNSLSNPLTTQLKTIKGILPSESFLEYSDPSGFSFNYPDNLSIEKNSIEDDLTYADIRLVSKEVSGNLSLKITDSKYTSLDEWLKLNKGISKETKLGNLEAVEVKLDDRLLLGSLDKGILFTVEMPLVEESFWLKVYNRILADFTFITPEAATSQAGASSDDVIFEGEEVVE